MRLSDSFITTNKSAPDLESVNATLLLKGGFIRQVMSGVYAFLPLGLRVLRKIEAIVREEMDTIGQEVAMSALSSQETWRRTGRLETIDVQFEVRGGNEASRALNDATYILNSTHEDVVTEMLSSSTVSYKDLPFAFYQIQSKFRNEPRAKSGLLRGREFRMKDLYSFHATEQDFLDYYEMVKGVYRTVYDRLGIGEETYIVTASGKPFTDDHFSHEFQVLNPVGEDVVYIAEGADDIYNKEIAPSKAPDVSYQDEEMQELAEVEGVGIIGVVEVAEHLQIEVERTTKTVLFVTDKDEVIAVGVRGDYEINEEKLEKVLGVGSVRLADEDTVRKVTGAEVGYAGLLNLPDEVRVVMDESMQGRQNFECGANRTNYHTVNVNFGRDLPEPQSFYDVKTVREGDLHPETGAPYRTERTSEVGNIFPLEAKYSKAFDWTYTDEAGKQQPILMGSYGLGVSRVMGIIVEKFNDETGILWPEAIAPFQVHLAMLNTEQDAVVRQAESVHTAFTDQGIEVLFDDRLSVSPGEKFSDADLIGIPWRVVVSARTEGKIEVMRRGAANAELMEVDDFIALVT